MLAKPCTLACGMGGWLLAIIAVTMLVTAVSLFGVYRNV